MPTPYEARIQELQRRLHNKEFKLEDVPGYRHGQAPDAAVWHNLDYLDVYPQVYGREMGSNGIGKLREVALTTITPNEMNPMFEDDPDFFHQWELPFDTLDIAEMQDQSAQYQQLLEDNGVVVHRVDFPDPPVSPFGPMTYMWATRELLVLRGGSVIPKMGWTPFSVGRGEWLALWAFQNLSVPPILAITGKGVCEAGPCFFLAEDVFVGALSVAFNQEGLDQLYPTVARSAGLDLEDMTFLTIKCNSPWYFDPQSGASAHPDMLMGALDVDKVVIYPGGVDFETYNWLERRGYQMAHVERDEQIRFAPTNVMTLEPGLVIMIAEAKKAIAEVRKLGVEVLPVPYGEFLKAGGGLNCSTMAVWRDKGPYSTDR